MNQPLLEADFAHHCFLVPELCLVLPTGALSIDTFSVRFARQMGAQRSFLESVQNQHDKGSGLPGAPVTLPQSIWARILAFSSVALALAPHRSWRQRTLPQCCLFAKWSSCLLQLSDDSDYRTICSLLEQQLVVIDRVKADPYHRSLVTEVEMSLTHCSTVRCRLPVLHTAYGDCESPCDPPSSIGANTIWASYHTPIRHCKVALFADLVRFLHPALRWVTVAMKICRFQRWSAFLSQWFCPRHWLDLQLSQVLACAREPLRAWWIISRFLNPHPREYPQGTISDSDWSDEDDRLHVGLVKYKSQKYGCSRQQRQQKQLHLARLRHAIASASLERIQNGNLVAWRIRRRSSMQLARFHETEIKTFELTTAIPECISSGLAQ